MAAAAGRPAGEDLELSDGTIASDTLLIGLLQITWYQAGGGRIVLPWGAAGDPHELEYSSGSDDWIDDTLDDHLLEYDVDNNDITSTANPTGSLTFDRDDSGRMTLTLEINSTTVCVWSAPSRYWRPRMSVRLLQETLDDQVVSSNCSVCVSPKLPDEPPTTCSEAIWGDGLPWPIARVQDLGFTIDWTDAGLPEYASTTWADHIDPVTAPTDYQTSLPPTRLNETVDIQPVTRRLLRRAQMKSS